MVCNYPI